MGERSEIEASRFAKIKLNTDEEAHIYCSVAESAANGGR